MTQGFDCATPLTEELATAFRADGMEFVCRYLVPSGWKALTRREAEIISESGLRIVSVFETTADRALGGRQAGLNDGAVAARTAAQVGQPEGSTIYFAVDFDARTSQMQTVLDYIQAAGEASSNFLTGVYGSYAVIEATQAAGVCSRYWQTRAWSYGKVSSYATLHQYDCGPDGLGKVVHGIRVDLNEAFQDVGGWSTMDKQTLPQLPADVANNIINSYLKKTWEDCERERAMAKLEDRTADAAAWLQLRDWQHHLAEELRKAAGLPSESQ